MNQYPVVALHIRLLDLDHILTIPYNGALNSHHLIKFLSKSLRPLIYVSSRAELIALKLDYQAIVLSYFDPIGMRSQSEILEFYTSAMYSLQDANLKDVAFGVITSLDLAASLSFKESPSIHLALYNSTIVSLAVILIYQ